MRFFVSRAFILCLVLAGGWFTYTKVNSQSSQVVAPPGLRANKNTFSPLMDVLAPKRPRVTDEQLARIKNLQIENLWGAVQNKGYKNCFVSHWSRGYWGCQESLRPNYPAS